MTSTIDFGYGPKTFFNGTPHAINIIKDAVFCSAIRKYVGGTEIATIPPSGVVLSARLETQPVLELGSDVTVARQQAINIDALPEEAGHVDFIIVSAMYGVAYRQFHGNDWMPLVTIRDLVVESETDPRPRGCRGFAVI